MGISLSELVPILQIAIGPAILISGVGLLLLSMTNRLGRVIDRALQLHGGQGVVAGAVVERLYREVRALRIYEGTSEIQKLVIARHLLRG